MQIFIADSIENGHGKLRIDEAHHAYRVLRMEPGQPVGITTGKGIIYKGVLTKCSSKDVHFKITAELRRQNSNGLHIAMAPTKNNQRFENFLEKATELGVSAITPLICRHSERKIYKAERGMKVIESACKQSKKAIFPILYPPVNFTTFINDTNGQAKYIAHLKTAENIALQQIEIQTPTLFLIGPEGDFHPEEIALAQRKGFKSVLLGSEVLRTETAGILVAAHWNLKAQK